MSEILPGATLARFPFPFDADSYMYSVNVEAAQQPRANGVGSWGEHVYDVDGHYVDEVAERARILATDPARCQVFGHMRQAAWDVVEHATTSLAHDYPADFALHRDGDSCLW